MRIKDARQVFLGMWIRRVLEGRSFEVWGGQQRRDFTYVDDAAEAFIAAVLSPGTLGKVFNVGGSEPVRLLDVADMLVAASGEGSYTVRDFPSDRQKIDIGDYYTDDSSFRRLTGWRPRVELADALKRSVDFYRQHLPYYL